MIRVSYYVIEHQKTYHWHVQLDDAQKASVKATLATLYASEVIGWNEIRPVPDPPDELPEMLASLTDLLTSPPKAPDDKPVRGRVTQPGRETVPRGRRPL